MNQAQTHATQRSRGLPLAFLSALALCLALAVLVGLAAERFADSQILVFLEKRERAESGPGVDVFIVGASQVVASIRPERLSRALPPGTRVYNFGAPALPPSGGESLLRRYLESHEPPRLLVFAHEVMMYSDRRGEFEYFTLTHMLRAKEMWQATLADRRPYYALSWLSTRLPTVRYRDSIRSALGAWLLDRIPWLRPRVFAWLGEPDSPASKFRFEWSWSERGARNAELRAQLARDAGWHYWRENAMDLGQLGAAPVRGTPGWAARALPNPVQPFEPSPREVAALERVLALCRERGIRVLIPAMPHAEWYAQALRAGPGAERMDAFWRTLQGRNGVMAGSDPIVIYPSALYADPTHVNPRGAERFSTELAPLVARAYLE